MTRGRFIALEGGEGTGKSTQSRLLAEALHERGIDVIVTREPGGTPGAEAIRELLLHPPESGWNPRAEALLFAAARSDHVERRIRPALDAGTWVVCDRYVDSSRAYQGGAGGLGDAAIDALHAVGSEGLRPDLAIVVVSSPDIVLNRLAQRDAGVSDAIGGRSPEFHARVAQSFRALAEKDPRSFAVIDGDGTPDEVHQRIMAALEPMLDERR